MKVCPIASWRLTARRQNLIAAIIQDSAIAPVDCEFDNEAVQQEDEDKDKNKDKDESHATKPDGILSAVAKVMFFFSFHQSTRL